ncbi:MAG: hypothetical protein R2850_11015 [Bacteroidia bacterium]
MKSVQENGVKVVLDGQGESDEVFGELSPSWKLFHAQGLSPYGQIKQILASQRSGLLKFYTRAMVAI